MATTRRPKLRKLYEPTFGEELHRIYRAGKAQHRFNYLDRAAAISRVMPVSDQTLIRYELLKEPPPRPRQRLLVYLAIISYGFDPAEFGLTPDNVPVGALDLRRVEELIAPR